MDALVGLWMYMEATGSPRALLLLLLWLALLAADWGLLVRGVHRKNRKLRGTAYGLTALSLLLAWKTAWYFDAVLGGPSDYSLWDPAWDQLPALLATAVYGIMLFGFLCWGFYQRTRELTEETDID